MPKSLQPLTTGPILEDYDGTDFQVRYIDNGTNVQIIWNNGEERTYSVIPKPQNVSTFKLEQMMDCGEGRTEPHSTYLNIHAKMRHDTNAVTNGQAVLLSQFEEAELDILTSVPASYAYLYCFPGNWVGREILRRICRNETRYVGEQAIGRCVHKYRCSCSKPAPGAPPKLPHPSSHLKLINSSIQPSSSSTLIPSMSKRRAKDSPVSQPAPTQKKAKISAPRADMGRSNSRANGLDQGPQKLQAILANRKPANGPLPAPETAWSVKWDRRPDVRPVSAPKRSRSAVGGSSVVRGAVPPVTARSA